jgi:hypothetical protein
MRTFALVAVVVLLAGCKLTPRACEKMKTLCGTEVDSCIETRNDIREKLGHDALDKFDGCYLSANDCSEASGCVTGAAIHVGVDAAKSFLNGLEKELKKDPK